MNQNVEFRHVQLPIYRDIEGRQLRNSAGEKFDPPCMGDFVLAIDAKSGHLARGFKMPEATLP